MSFVLVLLSFYLCLTQLFPIFFTFGFNWEGMGMEHNRQGSLPLWSHHWFCHNKYGMTVTMIFFSNLWGSQTWLGLYHVSFCLQLWQLEKDISDIRVWDDVSLKHVTLEDVCASPSVTGEKVCEIRSVLNYWQNIRERITGETLSKSGLKSTHLDHFRACVR